MLTRDLERAQARVENVRTPERAAARRDRGCQERTAGGRSLRKLEEEAREKDRKLADAVDARPPEAAERGADQAHQRGEEDKLKMHAESKPKWSRCGSSWRSGATTTRSSANSRLSKRCISTWKTRRMATRRWLSTAMAIRAWSGELLTASRAAAGEEQTTRRSARHDARRQRRAVRLARQAHRRPHATRAATHAPQVAQREARGGPQFGRARSAEQRRGGHERRACFAGDGVARGASCATGVRQRASVATPARTETVHSVRDARASAHRHVAARPVSARATPSSRRNCDVSRRRSPNCARRSRRCRRTTWLYEKVRYLQSYAAPAREAVIPISADAATVPRAIRGAMKPFAAFRGRERTRAISQLNPLEKALHVLTRVVMSHRRMRVFFMAYAIALHLLVFRHAVGGVLVQLGATCALPK